MFWLCSMLLLLGQCYCGQYMVNNITIRVTTIRYSLFTSIYHSLFVYSLFTALLYSSGYFSSYSCNHYFPLDSRYNDYSLYDVVIMSPIWSSG